MKKTERVLGIVAVSLFVAGILFSDGYADQFGGKKRKKFKYKAFKQLILEHSSSPMQEQRLTLQETMRTWQGKHEQIDDMVIVGIRI